MLALAIEILTKEYLLKESNMPSDNKNLDRAKKVKNDEFYTRLVDIEKELKHYEKYFEDKIVYCNCDNLHSNFVKYFKDNFERLGLNTLIISGYNKEGKGEYFLYNYAWGGGFINITGDGDGDFRSARSIRFLKFADIVITNPPFSLFREYVAQLMEYNKKFLIIGGLNAITYKEIFKLIKDNKIMPGVNGVSNFTSDADLIKNSCARWFTNLHHGVINNQIELYKKYNESEYLKYCNYNAINVDRVKDIPIDYDGEMGVPISFMDKYNPSQFKIIGIGTVSSIQFTNNRKMEILDKNANPTNKFTRSAKGKLYMSHTNKSKKLPSYKDVETGELYDGVYLRIIIKKK